MTIGATAARRCAATLLTCALAGLGACGDSGAGSAGDTAATTTGASDTTATTGAATTVGPTTSDDTSASTAGSSTGAATTGTTGAPVSECGDGLQAPGEMCFAIETFVLGVQPTVVTAGDLDLDGFVDLVTANYGAYETSVLYGDGTGAFAPLDEPLLSPMSQRDVVMGDVNGDGEIDLVGANNFLGFLIQYHGQGARAFSMFTQVAAGAEPRRVELADLDGDGALDVLAVSEDPGPDADAGLVIRLGDGLGEWAPPSTYAVGAQPYDLAVADVNGDGALDVVVTNWAIDEGYSDVQVRYGDGAGGLQAEARVYEVANGTRRVILADYNGDGARDILTASYEQDTISYLPGDGAGEFGVQSGGEWVPLVALGPLGAYDLGVADFNDDELPDVAAVHRDSGVVTVLEGAGDEPPTTLHTYKVGLYPLSLAVADFNEDGRPDIAAGNSFSGSISVLLADP